jgi:hypothetical protein
VVEVVVNLLEVLVVLEVVDLEEVVPIPQMKELMEQLILEVEQEAVLIILHQ